MDRTRIAAVYSSFLSPDGPDQLGRPDIPAGPAYMPWRLRILDSCEFGDLSPEEQLIYLSSYGILAPTTHNTVPQRFILEPDTATIRIFLDRNVVLPHSDGKGRQSLVSAGAVAESIRIAAAAYGRSGDIEPVPEGMAAVRPAVNNEPRYAEVYRLRLRSQSSTGSHLTARDTGASGTDVSGNPAALRSLLFRKVVRAEYDDTVPVPRELEAALQTIAGEYRDMELHLIINRIHLTAMAKIQEIADRTVIERDTFATELGDWLLPNTDTERTNGMRGCEFGFPDDLSDRMHKGLRRELRLLPDEIAAFATGSKVMLKSSSAICAVCVRNPSPLAYADTGRAYLRMSLALQDFGFVHAMHAAVAEVPVAGRMLAASLRTRALPSALFRIGKTLHDADRFRPRGARPSLDALLIDPL